MTNDKADSVFDVPIIGTPEQASPYERCIECDAEAHFGYLNDAGELEWFCKRHRRAQCWANARR
jgi:hypothetical protein